MRLPILLGTVLGLLGAPLAAQSRLAVFVETGTPVIATEILLATGPADEEAEHAGLAYLSARAVTRPILPLLDSLGAHLSVSAEKDALSFSLIAAPDAWEAATQLLMVALFRDPPAADAIAREQRAIRAELAGRASNPADAVDREADVAFFGADHPWGRPAVGTAQTVARLTPTTVDAFLRARYQPERAVAVVVGAVDERNAREHLLSFLGSDGGLIPMTTPPVEPAVEPVRKDYNSITTWVAATFPFPADADVESLRLLAHLAEEQIAFGPSRRSVYNARSEIVTRRDGGELRFTVVIPPQEAPAWADRIERTVRDIAESPNLPLGWAAMLRRYRGARLQQLDAPESRAREAARRLLVRGRAEALLPDLDRLTVPRLRAAALYLGEPTTVFLGPFLEEAG